MQTIKIELTKEELSSLISLLMLSLRDLGEDLNQEEGVVSGTGAYTLSQLHRSINDLSKRLIAAEEEATDAGGES
jgi:homoserine dehydrogenase